MHRDILIICVLSRATHSHGTASLDEVTLQRDAKSRSGHLLRDGLEVHLQGMPGGEREECSVAEGRWLAGKK